MELWIRSQDKTKLLKCESLVIDNTCPEMESVGEYCICDSFEGHIAKYKTKERALEVLDKIQNLIQPAFMTTGYDCKCEENPFDKLNFNLDMTPTKIEVKELSTYVYEMPKE